MSRPWFLLPFLWLLVAVPAMDSAVRSHALWDGVPLSQVELRIKSLFSRSLSRDMRQHLRVETDAGLSVFLRNERQLQWVDYFCGQGGVGTSLINRGGLPRGHFVDLVLGLDILTTSGYAQCIRLAAQIEHMGFSMFAPPCSNMIWMSRGSTLRCKSRPLGDTTKEHVRISNEITKRCVFLVEFLMCRGVQWLVEQPLTSIMFMLPFWRSFLKQRRTLHVYGYDIEICRKFIWMGHWDSSVTWKPTILLGATAFAQLITTQRPAKRQSTIVKKTTQKQITVGKSAKVKTVYRIYGSRVALRKTQVYPVGFCDELALLVARFRKRAARLHKQGLV